MPARAISCEPDSGKCGRQAWFEQPIARCIFRQVEVVCISWVAQQWTFVVAPSELVAESDSKKERVEDACVTAAMTDYVKANDALVQQTATVMSVDATIAQRRLQEEYCLRFVRCSLDNPNSAIFRVQFDSCPKDEALEKYEAIPGDTD